jgi:DNA-binding response OmpR family regulator
MEELTLITPTFLFSAISLLLLAYTNRFLSYAQLVRTLKDTYLEDHNKVKAAQIANLRQRLYLTRAMQLLGISSLFFCVVTMLE